MCEVPDAVDLPAVVGIELSQEFQEAVVGCICGRLGMTGQRRNLGFEPFSLGKSEAILFDNVHVLRVQDILFIYTVYYISY